MDGGFEETLIYSGSSGLENSDVEDTQKSIGIQLSSPEITIKHVSNEISNETSESADEDDDMNISMVKSRKNARILSSDDDDDGKKENIDEESQLYDKNSTENQSSRIIRPSICDSDTKSSSGENQSDEEIISQTKKLSKKLKKKRSKKQHKPTAVQSDSEDDSENNAKRNVKMSIRKSKTSSQSSDDSDSSKHKSDETENVKPREKLAQRVKMKHHQYIYENNLRIQTKIKMFEFMKNI